MVYCELASINPFITDNKSRLHTWRGILMLQPRLATPDEKSWMLDVSCLPVNRRALSLPSLGSYALMCSSWCLARSSMAFWIGLRGKEIQRQFQMQFFSIQVVLDIFNARTSKYLTSSSISLSVVLKTYKFTLQKNNVHLAPFRVKTEP